MQNRMVITLKKKAFCLRKTKHVLIYTDFSQSEIYYSYTYGHIKDCDQWVTGTDPCKGYFHFSKNFFPNLTHFWCLFSIY